MLQTRLFVGLLALCNSLDANRDPKFFPIFTIINFPNDVCTAKSGDTGTCFASTECSGKSGTVDGTCASGFGVCCVFTISTCSGTVTQNTSYITNPSYSTPYTTAGACAFSVTPLSSNICQLRLDFTNFATGITAASGVCSDSFAVSVGSNRPYPNICGTNTGEHIYLETGMSTSAQTLTFTLGATPSATWKILVSQIPCNVNYKAPDDCLQYFTGIGGNVRSFNFAGQMMSTNQRYVSCVRQEEGHCGIQWSETQGLASTLDNFDLSNDATAKAGTAATAEAAWISIPASIGGSYSGEFLSEATSATDQTAAGSVKSSLTPFVLNVQTRTGTNDANGFDLTYHQTPCIS